MASTSWRRRRQVKHAAHGQQLRNFPTELRSPCLSAAGRGTAPAAPRKTSASSSAACVNRSPISSSPSPPARAPHPPQRRPFMLPRKASPGFSSVGADSNLPTPSSTSSSGSVQKLAGRIFIYCLKRRSFQNIGCLKHGENSPALTSSTCRKCPRLFTLQGTSPNTSPKTPPFLKALDGGAEARISSCVTTTPENVSYQPELRGTESPTI